MAGMATLSINIEAKLAQLSEDMGKAVRISEKAASDMQAKWTAAGKSIGTAMGALGGAAAVAGLGNVFRSLNDGVDALNDFADATGVTVEAASQLEDIALRTGTSLDVAQTAVTKLNKALSDGDPNGDTAKVLKAIGLSADELRRLAPEQALQKVAEALNQYGNDGNKARIVQELFGKSLKEVAPLLKDLAENGLQAATVTSKQAEEAEKLNKEFFALQKNTLDAGRYFAGPLVEGLNKAIDSIRAAKKEFGGFWAGFAGLITESGGGGNNLTALQGFQKELGNVQARIVKLRSLESDSGPVQAARAKEIASLEERGQKLQKLIAYQSSLLKLNDGSAGGGRGGGYESQLVAPDISQILGKNDPKQKTTGGKSSADKVPREFEDFDSKLLKDTLGLFDDTASAKAEKLNKQFEILRGLAGKVDPTKLQEVISALEGPHTVDLPEDVKALRDEVEKLYGQSTIAKTERYTQLQAEAKSQWEQGAISVEKYVAITEQVNKGLASLSEKQEETAKQASTFWDEAQRNIQDTLGSGFADILNGEFDNIGKSFSRMLKNMVAQAIAADLANSLFGSMGKDGKRSGDGWVDQGISWLSSTFGGGRATGGSVQGGKFYEVNEQGPELLTIGQRTLLMMGGQSGTVTPLGRGGSGAMSVSVNVNNTVGEIVTPSQLMQVAEQTRRAVMAGVADARMRGRMA
jgi:hypothetical protein